VGSGLIHGGTDPHHRISNRRTTASIPAGSRGDAGLKRQSGVLHASVTRKPSLIGIVTEGGDLISTWPVVYIHKGLEMSPETNIRNDYIVMLQSWYEKHNGVVRIRKVYLPSNI
jgi:hypothetical protein